MRKNVSEGKMTSVSSIKTGFNQERSKHRRRKKRKPAAGDFLQEGVYASKKEALRAPLKSRFGHLRMNGGGVTNTLKQGHLS